MAGAVFTYAPVECGPLHPQSLHLCDLVLSDCQIYSTFHILFCSLLELAFWSGSNSTISFSLHSLCFRIAYSSSLSYSCSNCTGMCDLAVPRTACLSKKPSSCILDIPAAQCNRRSGADRRSVACQSGCRRAAAPRIMTITPTPSIDHSHYPAFQEKPHKHRRTYKTYRKTRDTWTSFHIVTVEPRWLEP